MQSMTQPPPIGSKQLRQLQHGPPALARSSMCQSTTIVISHTATVGHRLGGPRTPGTPSEVMAGQEVTWTKGMVMAMALLQPMVCACVCLSVMILCMHSGLGNQVSHPPGLHLMCAHNICKIDDAQLSGVLLLLCQESNCFVE